MSNEIKIKIESTSPVADPVNLKTVKYDNLSGKPKINGVELVGDKSTADLGIEVDTSKFAEKTYVDAQDETIKTEIDTAYRKTVASINQVKADQSQLYDNQITLRDMVNEKDDAGEYVKLTTTAQTAIPAINELNAGKADKTELADYLPLSGGTMTGQLEISQTASYDSYNLYFLKLKNIGPTKENTLAIGYNGLNISISYAGIVQTGSIVPGGSNSYDMGSQYVRWRTVYVYKLNNGADLTVPTEGGTLARIEDIDAIGGDGTAGQVLTKTEDGMAWQDASGGGTSLPDQAGNAGKGLLTDGAKPYWGDVVVNNSPGVNTLAIGTYAKANGYGVVVGYSCQVTKDMGVAIGLGQRVRATGAIQIGVGASWASSVYNDDANTFKVSNVNGNFEMMSADGTIPAARHAALPTEDGTYVLKLVIADGVPTMQWVAE